MARRTKSKHPMISGTWGACRPRLLVGIVRPRASLRSMGRHYPGVLGHSVSNVTVQKEIYLSYLNGRWRVPKTAPIKRMIPAANNPVSVAPVMSASQPPPTGPMI